MDKTRQEKSGRAGNFPDLMASDMKENTTPTSTGAEKVRDEKLLAQAERLQERAWAAGYRKQATLARDAGINAQTLGSYWLGDRGMTYDRAKELARVLKTTVEYLLHGEGPASVECNDTNLSQAEGATATTLQIRTFSTTDVSSFVKIREGEPFPWKRMITLDNAGLVLGKDYAQLEGPPIIIDMPDNSMSPIPKGSHIVVLPNTQCPPGSTVLGVLPKLGISVFRKLIVERGPNGTRKILRATNAEGGIHQDLELDEPTDFCWVAKRAIIDL